MRSLPILLLTLFTALLATPARAQNHIAARLIAESSAPAPGSEVTLALDMTPAPGWHGYWINPGEAGFPARFTWTLPAGVVAGAPEYPVPTTLVIAGLMNHVFEGEHAILFRLRVPAAMAKGAAIPVKLSADWLACTDQICVPEHGDFALALKVGDGAKALAARFDGFRAKLPAPLAADAHFERRPGVLRIAIPFPAGAALDAPHVFALSPDTVAAAAPQKFARSDDTLIATLAAPKDANAASVAGVLAIGGGRGLSLTATPGPVPADPAPPGGLTAVLLAIGGALLGGLILNIMPCVFPILSLKALSLAKAGTDERAARRDALAYAGGAVATCVALGAVMLTLKAGWAFQLQDARVVLVLLVLVAAIALNLAGLFELPSFGGGIAVQGNGFLTGALAAFVATPCTGPFMGAALGAALVLPPAAALGVFAGLGLGLALPFLAVGFVPAIRRMLPRPGGWMARLRHILAVPMALTALWLGWLLWRQAGAMGLAIGLGGVAVAAIALGWAGARQRGGKDGLALASVALVTTCIGGAVLVPTGGAVAVTADTLGSEPFSETRLTALRAQNRPVFVYFTADWCLTCKVNERVAIDRAETKAAFDKAHVATLVGDWTRGDPVIGAFLTAQGRAGVPLYLYYRPGAATPETLPQVLTPAALAALTGA